MKQVASTGVYWMVYHAYDAKQIGIPSCGLSQLRGRRRLAFIAQSNAVTVDIAPIN